LKVRNVDKRHAWDKIRSFEKIGASKSSKSHKLNIFYSSQ
jgi:hypothetical protein